MPVRDELRVQCHACRRQNPAGSSRPASRQISVMVGLGTAASVAGRSGIGARAVRPHADIPTGRYGYDAATTGADARNIIRQGINDEIMFQFEGGVDERLARGHQRDVTGGTTDVSAQQIGFSQWRCRNGHCQPCRLQVRQTRSGTAPAWRHRGRDQVCRAVGKIELAAEKPRLAPGRGPAGGVV